MAKPEDFLEKFILEHKQEFDSADPPPEVLDQIISEINLKKGKKTRTSWSWMWRAAAVLFFGISAYLFFQKESKEVTQNGINEVWEQQTEDFANTERYYNSMIQVKRQELLGFIDKGSPYYTDFKNDIGELDSMYTLLKKEFDFNNHDLVLDAMIKNLQLRIEIMDKQLQIIQQVQNENQANNDKVTI